MIGKYPSNMVTTGYLLVIGDTLLVVRPGRVTKNGDFWLVDDGS